MNRTSAKRKRKGDAKAAAAAADRLTTAVRPPTPSSARPALAVDDGLEPTRRARALRRRAGNRSRQALGKAPLPELVAGTCEPCGGWGTLGSAGVRCQGCLGTGEPR